MGCRPVILGPGLVRIPRAASRMPTQALSVAKPRDGKGRFAPVPTAVMAG